jgi:integrase/recombinase XerD
MTTSTVSPLRQRMIEDMNARKLGRHSQRSHIASCKRFAAFLKRSPSAATAGDVRLFQLHLVESGASIGNRNRIMSGVKFLLRVTLRRHDLAAEIYHLKEPLKLPLIMSADEAKRVLAMAGSLKVQVMLALGYGCGLRAGEICRLKAGDIDSAQNIIRIVQAKGRKDRHVMLPPKLLGLLRQWWKVRPTRDDAGVPPLQRWLFPGRRRGKPSQPSSLRRGAPNGWSMRRGLSPDRRRCLPICRATLIAWPSPTAA